MSKHKNKQQYVQTEPKKAGRGFLSKVIIFVGFISAINAIISLVAGYGTFQTQWAQTEWPATTAQVVEVSQGHDVNQNPTPAEIRYEYQVDGTTYQGTYQEDSTNVAVGLSMPVRYDPDHPEVSTTNMQMDLGFLIQTSLFGVLAIVCLYGPAVYSKRKDRMQHRLPVR
ncbi:DUF3592 domain-containing protein [Pseudoflavonifractor sp. An85]|uniref:DUF3592 domain-containing protein n=1 Tax=Pseudoflavonifractor sp. An85 TaxID=1965661 RepID=UPI000B36ACF1|nr:DUF3592 domain-containing protein [Pseudoflavonifractor sp. An85]OUN26055.1 hypothetical protein B5G37_02175 [Pseudoflavonifractor sp. An85]